MTHYRSVDGRRDERTNMDEEHISWEHIERNEGFSYNILLTNQLIQPHQFSTAMKVEYI